MKIQELVDKVPDYKAFLTVDELDKSAIDLAKEFPSVVTIFEAGTSRLGYPIQCLKIGNGPMNALCFAFPHPNEPIGAMTMDYFSRVLAEDEELRDELGFTWYIIKCIDPDGARLNEKWFKGPFTIYNYTKHFFRPVGYEQVEWTFPIDYKDMHFHNPLPETKVLMDLIEETSPEFMYSLHNAGFGGAYWYLSHDIPEIYEGLRNSAIKQEVALSLGEPEAPFVTEFAPAIFKMMNAEQIYDYIEKFTGETPKLDAGTSSADYALKKAGSVTLLTELPYFFDDRIQDMSDGDMTRKEAIYQNIEMCKLHFSMLERLLHGVRPYISVHNPFSKLVNQILAHQEEDRKAKENWANSDPDFAQKAKVSHIFDNLYTAKFYNGLALGLTVRTFEFELERLEKESDRKEAVIALLKKRLEKGEIILKNFCDELEQELNYSAIPIQKLVRIQVESGLIVANHVSKKNTDLRRES